MFKLSAKQAKEGFFDREKIVDQMDRTMRRTLNKIGAYVRKVMRNSMKHRGGVAPEGTPPSSHTALLKRGVFYSYDNGTRSVVIGPTIAQGYDGSALSALEFGGESLVKTVRDKLKVLRRVKISPHPYARPALETSMAYIPEAFADSMHGDKVGES